MARVHFVCGKGGVGRSTFAAALARRLSEDNEGPVLLLEVQGSGRSLQLCGLEGPKPFVNTSLPDLSRGWGAKLLPRETFRQYFSLMLTLGNEFSSFAAATSMLRNRLVDAVVDNPIVSAFIDVCPGLEPAVLLGKLHWEATSGREPESGTPWKHVIVDGPATGHGIMLFKSTNALLEVFGAGLIFKQAAEIMAYMRDPSKTTLYLVTTPEELPVKESLEMSRQLEQLSLTPGVCVANRCGAWEAVNDAKLPAGDDEWTREAAFELENLREQRQLFEDLRTQLNPSIRLVRLPEVFSENPIEIARRLSREVSV